MKTVLITAPYFIPELERFTPVLKNYDLEWIVPHVEERMEEADLLKYAGEFDGTICGDDKYTEEVLKACAPRLKVISKWGTGIDSIDSNTAESLGIRIGNTPNAFTLPVSDSVLGYILTFARLHPFLDREMKAGRWKKIRGRSLSESTIGVIGVGNIGKAVIRRTRAFGAKILGNDIQRIAPDFVLEYSVEMTSLPDLLARSDFVSVNCDLNPTSYHLINEQTLGLMKPTAFLINTARGPIVDENALIDALRHRKIAGAALDVFEHEPLPKDSPLLQMDNVMLAPHNSNSSPSAWERVHWNTIRNLLVGLGIPHDDLDEMRDHE